MNSCDTPKWSMPPIQSILIKPTIYDLLAKPTSIVGLTGKYSFRPITGRNTERNTGCRRVPSA